MSLKRIVDNLRDKDLDLNELQEIEIHLVPVEYQKDGIWSKWVYNPNKVKEIMNSESVYVISLSRFESYESEIEKAMQCSNDSTSAYGVYSNGKLSLVVPALSPDYHFGVYGLSLNERSKINAKETTVEDIAHERLCKILGEDYKELEDVDEIKVENHFDKNIQLDTTYPRWAYIAFNSLPFLNGLINGITGTNVSVNNGSIESAYLLLPFAAIWLSRPILYRTAQRFTEDMHKHQANQGTFHNPGTMIFNIFEAHFPIINVITTIIGYQTGTALRNTFT